jgi:hypothetical protein
VAALDSGERPTTLDRARLERQMRELGARRLAGDIADEAYLTSLRDLRQRLADVAAPSPGRLAADRAVAWLRALGATIEAADVPEAKAELVHAIYERTTSPDTTTFRRGPRAPRQDVAEDPQPGRSGGRSAPRGSRGSRASPSSPSHRRPYWSGIVPQPQ